MLFHKDIGFPSWFSAPSGIVELCWTRHADVARFNDRYGEIRKYRTLPLDSLVVIEIETDDNVVKKILYRGRYNDNLDICFAIIPDLWLVKTVWLNERNDIHNTLDRSRYNAPNAAR